MQNTITLLKSHVRPTFNLHGCHQTELVRPQDIDNYAKLYALDKIAKDRYSSLFVINLMMLEKLNGIDPHQVTEELIFLEGKRNTLQTKPASQFKRDPLKGLWHKHFMPALPSVMAHNILNHLGKDGLKEIVEEIFDPTKNAIATEEMFNELANRIVIESLENRASQEKLTGEWIVFAKENACNYYLGIWSHKAGDARISSSIKAACIPEFPFLKKYSLQE